MIRAAIVACLVLAVGCGGGGGSGAAATAPAGLLCDPNSAGIALARPSPGQTGVATSTTTIEVVDDGDLDQLYSLSNQFDLTLTDNLKNVLVTTSLTQVQDATAPHPFGASSFFFEGTLNQALVAGRTYAVALNATISACTALPVGTFST